MLLSIFTPTHHPTYIDETYNSILRQRYKNWEWVIVPNGDKAHVPDHIRQDKRVRVIPGAERFTNIGAIKRHACMACKGDAFIELDHDDYLMPGDALDSIAAALHTGAGFVYSDTVLFTEPGLGQHQFSVHYGWEHYDVDLYGRQFFAARNFELTPRSLCEVYFAPDHVRCWERHAYHKAGGHNPDMSVCDDHQLIVRTYLSGAKFQHTGGCHYVYRMFPGNTVKARQKQINELTAKNKREYSYQLIKEWVRRNNHKVADVGEMLKLGWKFERDLYDGFGQPNTLGAVYCHNALQFCPPDRVIEFFNQAYQALIPGGYLDIEVPSTNGQAAYLDPTYKSHFNPASFLLYTRRSLARQNPLVRCRFQLMQAYDVMTNDFQRAHNLKYAKVQLVALKGQRQPGLKHI